ncbi:MULTISPECIES: flagellar basal body P-ring protein FlgI [Enterobacter]|jgi:flagellar P-ring protein precursor FlgI|uniref:Flagellar P-ring protein n=1 Tax=Enterobacter ludwigii TaxID=299767 RepID=A0AAX3L600_9ENTR|nr:MULTISPECIES: flagellar basal body P-ring protein FlgI [Enterobacter]AHE70064.1 flagellar basal body P-ring protein [Enterobacter ludwigii]AOT43654.1 flagellar biosynthesis protein FlgA [Enterobacter ludwigii]KIF86200.1 flagellar basal body P-ring biosynthesis protein FlgA [Enterobacter ludwigii]KLP46854.1 flagellar basal body P-ring biosynthesis protein FlgA [Enterobacter ludwigii]KUQ40516.1 flagellar biosynthesis protein FlgA [Enterobacter ludwigii]
MKKESILFFLSILLYGMMLVVPKTASAERIRDLATVQGVRSNSLMGYGLIVGLDGTGDQTMQAPFTGQSLNNMLSQLGITVPAGTNMQLKNIAAVMVTAELPPFARPGDKLDIVVSSVGNAKSLRGGTLLMTPLKGADNQIYAIAQGNILISGAGAQAGGSRVQVNQLNGGRISGGATVEREVPNDFATQSIVRLQLNESDFSLAQQISDAINQRYSGGAAIPEDARTVRLFAPPDGPSRVRFLANIQDIPLRVNVQDAKVIVNSRTGSVVMNRHVSLDSCAVAHGSLTVEVMQNNIISQPDTPFGGGETVVVPQTDISVRDSGGSLQHVRSSTDLNAVIRALNSLGATPNELMSVLQAMKNAGCLRAKLEVN